VFTIPKAGRNPPERPPGATEATAHHRWGLSLAKQGDLMAAEKALHNAIAIDGNNADTHFDLGVLLQSRGRPGEAEQAYRSALMLRPDHLPASCNLARTLSEQGRTEEAAAGYRQVLSRQPDFAQAWLEFGILRHEDCRFSEAASAYRRALAANPALASAQTNLASVLQAQGRLKEAESLHRDAAARWPANPIVWQNLGVMLDNSGQTGEAITAFRTALRYAPDYATAHVNLAHALLRRGDFTEGWREYEWRWKGGVRGLLPMPYPQPIWRGEPLEGRTILIYAEQGLGDSLQFCRFAQEVADRGGRVVLQVQQPLVRLLASVPGVSRVVATDDPLPPFDLHLPMMSLPLHLGIRLDTIPAKAPYVTPDSAAVAAWGKRLSRFAGMKVGLVWGGAPRGHDPQLQAADRRRSIPLSDLTSLLATAGLTFVSLQKGEPATQFGSVAPELRPLDLMEDVVDFHDTAALVANLDLVITVDTSVAHLAGAMGKPVWILSRFDGCWRWLEDRTESPWYPTARLFRQTAPGDWDDVVHRVKDELRTLSQPEASR
jgi:tetratricopeptide (TPR) repeat protein